LVTFAFFVLGGLSSDSEPDADEEEPDEALRLMPVTWVTALEFSEAVLFALASSLSESLELEPLSESELLDEDEAEDGESCLVSLVFFCNFGAFSMSTSELLESSQLESELSSLLLSLSDIAVEAFPGFVVDDGSFLSFSQVCNISTKPTAVSAELTARFCAFCMPSCSVAKVRLVSSKP
jgi:hypothetical protein